EWLFRYAVMIVTYLIPSSAPEIYPLSLHDALPISFTVPLRFWGHVVPGCPASGAGVGGTSCRGASPAGGHVVPGSNPSGTTVYRSEEHTSELQSRENLVCRLLLEKKNKTINSIR